MNRRELEMRIQDLLEGELDASALDGLQQELGENPEAREVYRDYVRLQNALQIRSAGVDLLHVVPMDKVVERRQRRLMRNSGMAAAAVFIAGLLVMAFFLVREPPPTLAFTTGPGTEFVLSGLGGEETPQGMVIEEGSRLEIQRGTVELKFASGVRGIIQGPADLTLHRKDLLYINRGTGWFEVPEEAVGFKVSTPDLVLTDLGTEFGILTQPNFLDQVHVFTGKVEVLNRYGLKRKQLAVADEAWVAGPAGRWKKIPLRRDHFLKQLPKTAPKTGTYVFKDYFETDSSGDYAIVDYSAGGQLAPESLAVDADDNGILEIKADHTAQVVHKKAVLGVGECFKTDWLTQVVAQDSPGPSASQVLTDSPRGKRYSVRLRVDNGVFAIDFSRGFKGSYKWFDNSPYTAPETFWVERISATDFAWYRGANQDDRAKIAEIIFESDPGKLFVGLQAYRMTARFDNLAIVTLDEEPGEEMDE
ncbi:MAG: FecR family protein [Verrucomicrobiae bacterium]|nr:FecR family protein [Verrucomicrobiae bacterium]NNJ87026.1 hypothetical protein [Akkermansiaceae bacterium]